MFIAIGAFFILLIFGIVLKRSRRMLYSDFSSFLELDNFETQITRLAKTLVLPEEHGKGVEYQPVKKYVNKAYKLIRRKVIRNEELYEFEKWLYDNHYLLKRVFEKNAIDTFYRLPHTGKTPRIIIFARAIISMSEGRLDMERINTALNAQNRVAPLTFAEIENFDDALKFAILEKLASVSKKCVYYHKMLKIAVRAKNIAKKYINDNLYIYYTIKKNPRLSNKLKNYLDANAKRYDNIDYTFSALIVENNILTGALITSLLNIEEYTQMKFYLMPNYDLLKADTVFCESSIISKKEYLRKIDELSSKLNLAENEFIERLFKISTNNNVGKVLFSNEKTVLKSIKEQAKLVSEKTSDKGAKAYVWLNIVVTILFSAAIGAACLTAGAGIALAFLGLLGMIYPSKLLSDKIIALFTKRRPLFSLDFKDVPDNAKCEVIVPVYINGEKNLRENISHLNQIAVNNKFSNLRFTLLIDFSRADNEECVEDNVLLNIVKNELPENLGVAIRKRTKIGKKFLGYERKRGAVEDYVAYLMTENSKKFRYISAEYSRPVYFIVLDADSALSPQSIMTAINTFLHPLNQKYDGLSFKGKTNLYGITSLYSKRFINSGGRENYPFYSSLSYDLTGYSPFTGKGIFKLASFYEKLYKRLPENKILSHDIIEGALMNVGESGVCVYEDSPDNFQSDEDRRLRWARGDIQLLPFINMTKNNEKQTKINLFFRYLMYSNAFSVLYESYILIVFLVSAFMNLPYLALTAAVIFSLENVLAVFSCILSAFTFERLKYSLIEFIVNLYYLIEKIALLPYKAIVNFLLFIVTVLRMSVTKKGLLNWKPFAQVNVRTEERDKQIKQKEKLLENAKDIYGYFRNHDGLIPDHFTAYPAKGYADYTSPTNIGYSIIAECSAFKLGIIEKDEAEKRVTSIIEAALKLKKWNGHLYNWYDLKTKKSLAPNYVSSVDSGNFIASLIVASGIFGEKIQKIVDNYIKNVNFKSLFDENKGLFYIGYNCDKKAYDYGHYDNIVSEARLLNLIGISFGIPVSLWDNLSRDYSSVGGNTLLSWGGTAFEYLMPDLFLSYPSGGALKQTSQSAVKTMIRTKCNRLFGISESGYFAFDDNGNYRYNMFGIDNLSLKSENAKCVISPYSSYLMLPYAPNKVIKNLNKISRKEAYGTYGYYESIDFTKSPRIVLEYMAHHEGMSIAAIANYLCDDCIVKAFEKNEYISGAKILLTETKYKGKASKPEKNKFVYQEKGNVSYGYTIKENFAIPSATVLKCGDYSVMADDFGCGYSRFKNIDVTVFNNNFNKFSGAFFYVIDENRKIMSPTRAPLNDNSNYSVTFKKNEIIYENLDDGLIQTVYAPNFFSGELRKLKIENRTDSIQKYKIYFYTELALNTRDAYNAHRAYSNLFVETEVKNGVLIAKRRSKIAGKGYFAALYASGIDARYVSNRYNFLGRQNDFENPSIISNDKKRDDDNGTVLDPCLGFVGEINLNPHDVSEIEVFIAACDDIERLTADIERAKKPHFKEFIKKIPYIVENNRLYDLDSRFTDYLLRIIPEIIYKPFSQEKLYNICKNHKLFSKISSGFSKKPLLIKFEGNKKDIRQAVKTVFILKDAGIDANLVISYEETDGYYKPVMRDISKCVEGLIIGKDVFLIDDIPYKILHDICFNDFSVYESKNEKVNNPVWLKGLKIEIPEIKGFKTGEGYFTSQGYEIVPFAETTRLPYSNVICGEYGGTITSNNGGYTYYGNSRESKLTVWENDFTADCPSEWLLFRGNNGDYRLTENATVTYSQGKTVYKFTADKFSAETEVYIIENGGAKVYEVTVAANERLSGNLILLLDLALGVSRDKNYIYYKKADDIFEAINLKNGISCYLYADGGDYINEFNCNSRGGKCISSSFGNTAYGASFKIDMVKNECKTFRFVFGGDFYAVATANDESLDMKKRESIKYFSSLNPFEISTGNQALDILFNYCLPYQVVSCRINGRTSLYQAGGATGFRDTLQDLLTLTYIDPEKTREKILEISCHTFFEGDVQHWWHGDRTGVRTRISDDRLFLPYVVSEYIMVTGDKSILEEEVSYLLGKPLASGEESRYETPSLHEKTDTLLLHLERIIESAYRLGENGLLLIGGGDWNDALNAVGTETAGESVWLTMFYIEVLKRTVEYYDDCKEKMPYLNRIDSLKKAVEKTFTGRQFKRLITPSGEWLGDGYGKVMNIDIISQAWASLADICDKKYRELALNVAKNTLVDTKNGLIMLLTPPFDDSNYYGYINLYPKGIRENGGQYTHGAIWFIDALLREGRVDEAYDLLNMINPVYKCADKENTLQYMGEPYVLSADVYSNAQHKGRAGWTWYTGSASWCYKVIIEDLLGLKIRNNALVITPNPPKIFNGYSIKYRKKNSEYNFTFLRRGRFAIFENDVEITGCNRVPLKENEKRDFTVYF